MFACLLLLATAAGVRAADIALIGVMGERAAVLAVDGGEPKAVKVGGRWNGITVISVARDHAVVEIAGKRRQLALGQHYRSHEPAPGVRASAVLAADSRGHFFTEAMVNDVMLRFVVDTGASVVVIPGADAMRLGIDWRKGQRRTLQTANGRTSGYQLKLDKVRVGGIELHDVDGIVLEEGLSIGLLGMSFLNRVEMLREGSQMTLTRR